MILIYRFCNWEVSSSYEYKLQLPSAALSIPISPSPQLPSSPLYPQLPISPTPQQPSLSPAPHLPNSPNSPSPKSRRPGGRGRRGARWFPLVLHQQHGHHSFMLHHRVNMLSVVPHRRAGRSCGSSTLEADWLQLRAASVKIDCSSEVNLGVKSTWSTCTLNSGWAGLGRAGLGCVTVMDDSMKSGTNQAGLGWAGLGWVFAVQSMMNFEEQRATIHHDAPYIPIHYWCSGIAACAINKRVDVCCRGSVEGP